LAKSRDRLEQRAHDVDRRGRERHHRICAKARPGNVGKRRECSVGKM
jgi:hypothetical protein